MINSSGTINSGSSRGPSAFGNFTKPNIAAPGVDIWSTFPGNSWVRLTGTSMASPHSAGAVALLWSCNPALKGKIDQTAQLLQNSAGNAPAGNCSTSPGGGDYTYGYGYLDVLAAGNLGCSHFYTSYLNIMMR
jgi:subtilisin family serine protease